MHTSCERFKREYKLSYNMNYYFNLTLIKADLIFTKDMRSNSVIYYNCGKSDHLS